MRDRIRRKKFLLPVLLLFVSVYLLTAVACTSSDSGKTGGEAKSVDGLAGGSTEPGCRGYVF